MNDKQRIFVYQDRCPEGTAKLAGALAKAIPNMQPLVRNCISHFAKKGQDGKMQPDYADLAACHKSAAKALADQGLVVIQTVAIVDNGDTVLNTQLMHSSGEWVSSVLPVKASSADPQKMAAAITYARRTAYCAIVGLAADDDDNGSQAQAAAIKSSTDDEARVEKLLMKRLDVAKTADERDEVIATAKRGQASGHLSEGAVSRIETAAKVTKKKEAAA
jgi:hypothetical protein